MRFFHIFALSAAATLYASPVLAGTVVPGFTSTTLTTCDDCYSGAIPLGFTADFFGHNYTSAYVSNNGYLTFNAGQGTYTPTGLGSGYAGQPIIAPFFADVDTRGVGQTQYGTGTYNGMSAFGATYTNVGYFAAHTDKTDTFQVLLVNRSDVGAGDFDIIFNYNNITWETGDASGGHNGLGGISAAAGFNAGTGAAGTYYQLPGSLVNGALLNGGPDALVSNSNIGIPGEFLFAVRNGSVIIPGSVPEASTWAMMLVGFAAVGFAVRRRKPQETLQLT